MTSLADIYMEATRRTSSIYRSKQYRNKQHSKIYPRWAMYPATLEALFPICSREFSHRAWGGAPPHAGPQTRADAHAWQLLAASVHPVRRFATSVA